MKRYLPGIATVTLLLTLGGQSTFAQLDALRSLAGGKKAPPPKKIAHISLTGPLTESPVTIPPIFASEAPLSLKELLERLDNARKDDAVVALVLDVNGAALGFAQLEEVHAALRRIVAADKEIYVNADTLTTGTYALATAATHISLVPTGDLWLRGLYGETPYLRGALEKLGVVPDFEHCGDFKTGAESITRTGPSDASKEMTDWLLDSLYDSFVKLVAESRGFSTDEVRTLIDRGLYSAEDALAAKLIDSVQHRQDFVGDLKERYGEDVRIVYDYGGEDSDDVPGNMFAAFEMLMEMFNPSTKEFTEPTIAIIYVEGSIQMGAAQTSPFGSSSGAYSTTIRKALDRAAEEDMVKAVVLRVDSPGGSALASEIILDATRRVAAKKPLVVSMGNVAGSGGYYVTCEADVVFADKHTITASIGVLGGKLVTTGFWDKLGINWHANQRGAMAGLLSTAAPFSDEERGRIRHYMETVYGVFKDHVVEARGDKLTKPIEELASGRVFTGIQALEYGLVDEIGGLRDAIKFAARKSRQDDYELRVLPDPPGIFDMLGGGSTGDRRLQMGMGSDVSALATAPMFQAMLPMLAKTDPLRLRAVLRQLKKIEMLHQENVLMVMPEELLIR